MPRRPVLHRWAATAVLCCGAAFARDLPNLDVRAQTRPVARTSRPGPAGAPGVVASRDERTGAPTFIWMDPSRTSPAVSSALATRATVDAVARAHLADVGAHYGLSSRDIAGFEVRQIHDTGTGSIVVRLAPRVGNLEVFGESLAVVMDPFRQPIAVTGTARPSRPGEADALLDGFKLRPEQVVTAAYRDLVGVGGYSLRPTGRAKGDYQYFELTSTGAPERLSSPARAKPLAFRNVLALEAAYYLELETRDAAGAHHAYAYVVSAKTGQVLVRRSLIQSDASTYTYRVFADGSGQFRPFDGPFGSALSPSPSGTPGGTPLPPHVGSNLVTLAHGPISTGDPWLAPGATVTQGNNVDAYTDTIDPDGFTPVNPGGGTPDLRADLTSPATFDRTYDFNQSPDATPDQAKAAVTHLFFVNNWLHDWYYDVGFDERAGNAQASNLGRASEALAGDVLLAEAHDFSGVNNSNMYTPADGASPRMQMYLFSGPGDDHLTVNSPAAIAGRYEVRTAQFGPQVLDTVGDVVVVNQGGSTLGCDPISMNLTGKIALIDRGTCLFVDKVKNAQNAGAIGVIIASTPDGVFAGMAGSDPTITIGAMMVSNADGTTIKTAAASATVNVTLFRKAVVDLDGALDGAVVAHEWGHYISHRLVGGGDGFGPPITDGLGEGWADFHALLMMVRAEDAAVASNAGWSGVYAIGTYASSGGLSVDPAYFAIRRYPYSTDMAKNPLTFKHITTGVALPAGVPLGFAGTDNAEVHNTGEVWAVMLWECYASLLNAHPFQDAQDRMRGYLVAAYKATPPQPTFIEARDALLAVVGAADEADYERLGQAFARRGLGTGAIAPDPGDRTNGQAPNPPVVESFAWGGYLSLQGAGFAEGAPSCDADGVLDRGENGVLSVSLRNIGRPLSSSSVVQVSTATPGITIGDGGVFPLGGLAGGATGTVKVPVSLAVGAPAGPRMLDLSVAVSDPELDGGVQVGSPAGGGGRVSLRIDTDDLPAAMASDDMEATATAWSTGSSDGGSQGNWVRTAVSASGRAWFAEPPYAAASDEWLISPPLQVGSSPLTITFKAAWNERTFDTGAGTLFLNGVVLEVSTNDGASWSDVQSAAGGGGINPDYNVTLFNEGSTEPGVTNPLQGRRAWGAINPASVTAGVFPTFQPITATFGTIHAGKTIRIRLRSGSRFEFGGGGFAVDDVAISGITNTPFVKLVGDQLKCAPIVDAGTAYSVNEGAEGVLPGSYVPAAGTPTLHWEQTSGPTLNLSDPSVARPTFVAPQVTADTTATFTFTGSGIQGSSSSNLTVTIKDVPATKAGGCTSTGGSALPILALLAFGLLSRARRQAA